MSVHDDFDGLKRQFEYMGYNDPGLNNRLREELISGTDHFTVRYREGDYQMALICFFNFSRERQDGTFKLDDYDTLLVKDDDLILATRSFTGEVKKNEMREVLAKDAIYPLQDTDTSLWVLNPNGVTEYLHEGAPSRIDYWKKLNENTMNEENLNYLKDNLKYLGFDEKLHTPLTERINSHAAGFNLETTVPHFNDREMQYSLQFKKSDQTDRYFFNRYEALLTNGKPEEDKVQTFYINKGHGVTAKEAFNLLEGRAVYKTLENKEHQKYNVWMQLDFANKDERNNYMVNTFHDKYNYKLERALDKYNIVELNDPAQKAALIKSMQKGNTQQVTAIVDGKEVKAFVEASPEKRTINIYDEKMKPQEQAVYLKVPARKDLAQEKAEKEAQKQAEGQTQGRKKSRGVHH